MQRDIERRGLPLHAYEAQRRFAERFAGDGAGIDARPAHLAAAFDEGYPLTRLRSLQRGLLPTGATPNYYNVEGLHAVVCG
ncbi:MAG: hypothetical protein RhofKO_11000 [Rhodothermales bacterium]